MILAGLVVPGGLVACGMPDLEVRMVADIEAASGVEVSNLWEPSASGGKGGRVDLVSPPGSASLTASVFVEIVHVIEGYRQKYRSLAEYSAWWGPLFRWV